MEAPTFSGYTRHLLLPPLRLFFSPSIVFKFDPGNPVHCKRLPINKAQYQHVQEHDPQIDREGPRSCEEGAEGVSTFSSCLLVSSPAPQRTAQHRKSLEGIATAILIICHGFSGLSSTLAVFLDDIFTTSPSWLLPGVFFHNVAFPRAPYSAPYLRFSSAWSDPQY